MCVKQMAGSCISDTDMDMHVFEQLLPSLQSVEELVLTGIGEPLLHPDLVKLIDLARSHMPASGRIGFQSNGLLLNARLAEELLRAGLNTICFSVDTIKSDSTVNSIPACAGHSFSAVAKAISALFQAREKSAGKFEIGIEVVLTRENLHELPNIVRWAAENSIDYILTTHLLLYNQAAEDLTLFNPNFDAAVELFEKYNRVAENSDIDLSSEIVSYLKYAGTRTENKVTEIISALRNEAKKIDVRLNLTNLVTTAAQKLKEQESYYIKAQKTATDLGVSLFLPPLQANTERSCRFIDEDAIFISTSGEVMPCHYLWHTYSCRVLQEEIQVKKKVFGHLLTEPLNEIWQKKEYQEFRDEASRYEYSSCWSCSQGPCSNLVNDENEYANDCYGSKVPCGHCQWNLGGIRCL
jgi:putative metalloenzyme radical SAM/SPASM domain maturase